MPILESAEAFTKSYGTAMASASSTSLTSCAQALASHYGHTMTSFTFGHIHQFSDSATAAPGVASHMQKFAASGLGCDIRMVEHEITVVSESSALCHVTWEIFPKKESGVQGWKWTNVYGFRLPPGKEEGYWEFVVSDNEIGELLKRVPNFMEF